uniref:Uncharacterized protein MANES_10G145800 n=1 Tax=Rhizophora mucronata TaxID=61149 RepID=A0A2P2J3P5_RHIMU
MCVIPDLYCASLVSLSYQLIITFCHSLAYWAWQNEVGIRQRKCFAGIEYFMHVVGSKIARICDLWNGGN